MADEIRAYLDSVREFEGKKAKADQITQLVVQAGRALETWPEVTFSNLSIGFPLGVGRVSIDGSTWPAAIDIARAMSAAHDAHHAMNNAWHRVTPQDQSGLKPPPDLRQRR